MVEVNAVDADGKPIYALDGKMLKTKIQTQDATIADGAKQFRATKRKVYLWRLSLRNAVRLQNHD